MTYQIYALEHPVECKMRYVGLSRDAQKRFAQHTTPSKARQWIKDLLRQELKPILHILETDIPDLSTARIREKYWINYYEERNHPLKNLQGNWLAQYSRDEEESLFNHTYTQLAKIYGEDIASELAQITLIGYEKVGHDAWDTHFDAVVHTLEILHQKYGFNLNLSALDAAKITLNLFGYEHGEEEG